MPQYNGLYFFQLIILIMHMDEDEIPGIKGFYCRFITGIFSHFSSSIYLHAFYILRFGAQYYTYDVQCY